MASTGVRVACGIKNLRRHCRNVGVKKNISNDVRNDLYWNSLILTQLSSTQ